MNTVLRGALNIALVAGLATTLSGCYDDEAKLAAADSFPLLDGAGPLDWPLDSAAFDPAGFGGPDYGGPAYGGRSLPPLPVAAPMRRVAPARYGYADAYDYGPGYDDYGYGPDEPVYYDDSPRDGSYAWLAMAAMLGDVLGNAPPDYYFDYDGVQPWVWVTGDRYVRYAEPIRSGYRYYYYQPGRSRPFLVRDPYYSYGYNDERLVVIYDRDGRVLDGRNYWRQRRAASTYLTRADALYRADRRHRHHGVAAPRWDRHRTIIARDQRRWDLARDRRSAWQQTERAREVALDSHWSRERAARDYAARRFSNWRQADYRGAAPRFYHEAKQSRQFRKAVARQQERVTVERRQFRQNRATLRGGDAIGGKQQIARWNRGAQARAGRRADIQRNAALTRWQQSVRPQRHATAGSNDRRQAMLSRQGRARKQQWTQTQQRQGQLLRQQRAQARQSQALMRQQRHGQANQQRQAQVQQQRRAQAQQQRQAQAQQQRRAQAQQRQAQMRQQRQAQAQQQRRAQAQQRQSQMRQQRQAQAQQQRRAQAQQRQAQMRQQRQAQAQQQRRAQAQQRQSQMRQQRQAQAQQRRRAQAQQRQAQARQQRPNNKGQRAMRSAMNDRR